MRGAVVAVPAALVFLAELHIPLACPENQQRHCLCYSEPPPVRRRHRRSADATAGPPTPPPVRRRHRRSADATAGPPTPPPVRRRHRRSADATAGPPTPPPPRVTSSTSMSGKSPLTGRWGCWAASRASTARCFAFRDTV